MSIDPKYGRYCDDCGRLIVKAHRIFEGNEYCAICYPRVFVSKPCTHCSKPARVHRLSNEPPVCRACVRIGRLCVRCEKPIIKAGMISAGKPVCPSCVAHFKAAVPCSACGVLSTRLSAMPSAGIYEKVCDSCRTKGTHKTCSICRKHRKVVGFTNGEKPYCQACVPGASQSHQCPDCGVDVLGNGKAKCRSCLNRSQLFKEVDINELALTRDWAKALYRQFAQWLFDRQGGAPSLMKVFRSHQIFFERIDTQFFKLADLTAPVLLQTFGTSVLRKHMLVTQFMRDALALKITQDEKTESAELERIRNKLLENRKCTWGKTLEQFAVWLESSGVPTRTRRLYLATAESFCMFVKLADQPWSDGDIRRFLKSKPGLRANLFKFVGHCSRAYGWNVAVPPRDRSHTMVNSVPKTIPYLQKQLQKVSNEGLDQVDQGTLGRIIAKSFGFRIKVIMSLSSAQFHNNAGSLVLEVEGESVAIPPELDDIARVFLARL